MKKEEDERGGGGGGLRRGEKEERRCSRRRRRAGGVVGGLGGTWRGNDVDGRGHWDGGGRREQACDVTGSGVDDRRVNAPVAWFQPSGKRVDAHLHR